MMNVCWECGLYRPDKDIDPERPFAVCPHCGHGHLFRQLPLLMVCGASGTGKSEVHRTLASTVPGAVLLEADILWRDAFDQPEQSYRDFFDTWLRMSKNIGQAGRPVVLFCAGGIPENVETCVERRYFSAVHYLGLTCEAEELADRLRRRPDWRGASDDQFVRAQLRFNSWIVNTGQRASPPIQGIDTTGASIQETSARVAAWIDARLTAGRPPQNQVSG